MWNENFLIIICKNWERSFIRPVVSLKANTLFTSGDGSVDSPFVVETE